MSVWINAGTPELFTADQIAVIEQMRASTYVADLCVGTRYGWSEQPVAVFWQPEPPNGYANHFGIFRREGRLFITGAGCTVEGTWFGVQGRSGEVIFSRYRHDYRTTADGTAWCDGGRDYFRGDGGEAVELRLEGPRFVLGARGPNREPAAGRCLGVKLRDSAT